MAEYAYSYTNAIFLSGNIQRHTDRSPIVSIWCSIGYHGLILAAQIARTVNSNRYKREVIKSEIVLSFKTFRKFCYNMKVPIHMLKEMFKHFFLHDTTSSLDYNIH